MKWNEIAYILSAFENRLRTGSPMQKIQPLSSIKTLNGQEAVESVRWVKKRHTGWSKKADTLYGGKNLPKNKVLSWAWKSERV